MPSRRGALALPLHPRSFDQFIDQSLSYDCLAKHSSLTECSLLVVQTLVLEDIKLPDCGNIASADHSSSVWDPKTLKLGLRFSFSS